MKALYLRWATVVTGALGLPPTFEYYTGWQVLKIMEQGPIAFTFAWLGAFSIGLHLGIVGCNKWEPYRSRIRWVRNRVGLKTLIALALWPISIFCWRGFLRMLNEFEFRVFGVPVEYQYLLPEKNTLFLNAVKRPSFRLKDGESRLINMPALPEKHKNKNRIVIEFEVPGGSRLFFQSESISDLQNGGKAEEYLGLISTSVDIEGSSVVVRQIVPVKGPINPFRGVRVTLRRVEEGLNSD